MPWLTAERPRPLTVLTFHPMSLPMFSPEGVVVRPQGGDEPVFEGVKKADWDGDAGLTSCHFYAKTWSASFQCHRKGLEFGRDAGGCFEFQVRLVKRKDCDS